MKSLSQRKGQLNGLSAGILALVFASIVLVFGLIILQELRDTSIISEGTKINDTAYTAANTTLVGLGTFADFWEIIVLAVVIGVVIGLLLVVFGGRSQR